VKVIGHCDVEENFGRKVSEMYEENKRLSWKEVQKEREGRWNSGKEEVKDGEGESICQKKKRWN